MSYILRIFRAAILIFIFYVTHVIYYLLLKSVTLSGSLLTEYQWFPLRLGSGAVASPLATCIASEGFTRAQHILCTTVTIFSCTQSRRPHSATGATEATNRLQEYWLRNSLPSLIFICFVISICLRKTDRMCRHYGTRTYTDAYIYYVDMLHT